MIFAAKVNVAQSTTATTVTGKHQGFTLVELMVVMVIVATLAAIVTPMVVGSIENAKATALKENLMVMRKSLDSFYGDKGHYPEALEELVEEKYLRNIPDDPFVGNERDWVLTLDEAGGIIDLHSSYDEESKDGSYYREW